MRIKDWGRFQHYQDGKRKPEWIKLYRSLLDNLDWHKLDPKDAKVLVMLWMLASEHGGCLPSVEETAFRLRLPENEIKSILSRLPEWIEPSDSELLADCYQSDSPEEEREEQETSRKKNENETRAKAREVATEFSDCVWPEYPNKVGKPKARDAYVKARRSHSLQTILSGLRRYVETKPPDRPWLNPATFFNQERFLDRPAPVGGAPPRLSRTQAAAHKLEEKIINGQFGNGGRALREQGGEFPVGQLPKPGARPGGVPNPAHHPVHGEIEIIAPGDEPSGNGTGVAMPVPHRRSG